MPRYLQLDSPESKTLGALTQETNLAPTDYVLAEVGGVTVKITLQDLVDAVASQNLDAFGRLRVSNPQTLFDSKGVYDETTLLWSNNTTGTGAVAHRPNEASYRLSVDATATDTVVRQTHGRFNYQPGKSQLIFMTACLLGDPDTGVEKRFGLFDDNNGLFLQLDNTGLGFGIRTSTSGSPVDTVTYDGAWSLLNGGDGTLPTLDLDAVQILAIDYEWLGVGRVRFGFVIDGNLYWCHDTSEANTGTTVYMTTPTLPLRYEITSSSTGAGTDNLDAICGTVMSEGGTEFPGQVFAIDRTTGLTATAGAGNVYGVAGLRQQSGYLNSSFNLVSSHAVFNSSNTVGIFRLVVNPTVGAGSPSWTPLTNSIAEYSVPPNTVTFTAGTGTTIWSQSVSTSNQASVSDVTLPDLTGIPLGSSAAGTRDELWLLYETITASPVIYGGLGWKETF